MAQKRCSDKGRLRSFRQVEAELSTGPDVATAGRSAGVATACIQGFACN